MRLAVTAVAVALLATWGTAQAQIGVPNTPLVPPGQPLPPPFGSQPHPFNDSYPTQPWDRSYVGAFGLPVRDVEVPARTVVVPVQAASGTSAIRQELTVPGYLVTETTTGYIVHEHWGLQPMGNVYYWTLIPTYFKPKP